MGTGENRNREYKSSLCHARALTRPCGRRAECYRAILATLRSLQPEPRCDVQLAKEFPRSGSKAKRPKTATQQRTTAACSKRRDGCTPEETRNRFPTTDTTATHFDDIGRERDDTFRKTRTPG